jgi:diadenosine tetraphosphate (Ap4A) HIT family hydrolase
MCKLCYESGGFKSDLIITANQTCILMANLFPIGDLSYLVITKRHIVSISEATPEELKDLFNIVSMVVGRLKYRFRSEGINVFLNEGDCAGQTIKHVHFHVVARSSGDGIENFKRNSGLAVISPEQLEKHKRITP